jgi:hypothetical protein
LNNLNNPYRFRVIISSEQPVKNKDLKIQITFDCEKKYFKRSEGNPNYEVIFWREFLPLDIELKLEVN